MQGFRKVDPDRWEFANEYFLRGRRDLLNEIHRRKPSSGERTRGSGTAAASHDYAALEVGAYGGLAAEVDALKRDKHLLVQEVIRLRQTQQQSDDEIRTLSERVELTEQRQQQMVAFFAQALQHPALVQHLVASSPQIKRLEDGRRRKKRRGADTNAGSDSEGSDTTEPAVGQDAMIVHPNSAQQSLADLAQAFMQLLNTQSEQPKRNPPPPRNPSSSRPIIEEDPSSFTSSIPGIPPAGPFGSPLVINSTPADQARMMHHGSNNSLDPMTFASAPLGGDFMPLSGTTDANHADLNDVGPIIELPSLPSFNLDELDMDHMPDMLSMPSQDLLITDHDLVGGLSEGWNSQLHPPAGQTALPRDPGPPARPPQQ